MVRGGEVAGSIDGDKTNGGGSPGGVPPPVRRWPHTTTRLFRTSRCTSFSILRHFLWVPPCPMHHAQTPLSPAQPSSSSGCPCRGRPACMGRSASQSGTPAVQLPQRLRLLCVRLTPGKSDHPSWGVGATDSGSVKPKSGTRGSSGFDGARGPIDRPWPRAPRPLAAVACGSLPASASASPPPALTQPILGPRHTPCLRLLHWAAKFRGGLKDD